MFTNQWNAYLLGRTASSSIMVPSSVTLRTMDGSQLSYIYPSNSGTAIDTNNDPFSTYTSYDYAGIKFGYGSTPVTVADYCLANRYDASAGITSVSYSAMTMYTTANTFTVTYINTIRNDSSASKTITEVGLTRVVAKNSSNKYQVLVWREVLQTPIVLAAGETRTINTVITFPAAV